MKKFLVAGLGLALSFASFATSTTFVYDGSTPTFNEVLNGEQSHTEYRSEVRQTTCFRQEIAGYRSVCNGGYYGGGYYGGYYGPRGYGRGGLYAPGYYGNGGCYTQPNYITVSYSCNEVVKVPFKVKDLDVVANITVNVTNDSDAKANEEITAKLESNGTVSFSAKGSKNFLIYLKAKKESLAVSGSVKTIEATYNVELVPASALRALDVGVLKAYSTGISFNHDVDTHNIVTRNLEIKKRRFLLGKKDIYEGTLLAKDLSTIVGFTGASVNLKFSTLGIELKKGRYVFNVTSSVKTNGLLNASQFDGKLSKETELKTKIKK